MTTINRGTDMGSEELKRAKRELETSIQRTINEAVREFKIKTGRSPHRIHIHMANVTRMGELPDTIVGEVRVDL